MTIVVLSVLAAFVASVVVMHVRRERRLSKIYAARDAAAERHSAAWDAWCAEALSAIKEHRRAPKWKDPS